MAAIIKSLLQINVFLKQSIKVTYKCKILRSKLKYSGLLLFSLFYGNNHNVRRISKASLLLGSLGSCLALSHLHVSELRLRWPYTLRGHVP